MKKLRLLAMLLCLLLPVMMMQTAVAAENDTVSGHLVSKVDHFGVKDAVGFGGVPESFDGFIGTIVNVGAYPITVHSLGRLFYEGNTQEHQLKLVNAATGEDVAGAAVSVVGGKVDEFTYGVLTEPVTLEANTTYYLLSSEKSGGDYYSDGCDVLYSDSMATCAGYVKQDAQGYFTFNFPNSGFLSLDMEFSYTPTETPEGKETDLFLDIEWDAVRNDYHSYIGMKIITGSTPLTVTELGRIYLEGNVQEHHVKLVDGATMLDVPGASVIISGGNVGEITYVRLQTPVTLEADHPYLIMSREYINGDTFLEGNAHYLANYDEDCTIVGGNFFVTGYNDVIQLDTGFVGLNLKYLKEMDEPPIPTETEPKQTTPQETEPEPTASSPVGNNPDPEPNVISIWISVAAAVIVIAAVTAIIIRKKK